jgi:thiol-disulfide isomerase/thioredoxin
VKALLAVGLVIAAVACGGGDAHTALPDVTVRSLHDGEASLDVGALRGPAVINLWATWCAPCRKELPAFQQVSAARPDVRFIGVDIAEDAATARDYLGGLGVTFDQYLDDRGELTDALGTAVLPVTLVVDRAGRITTEHIGPMTVGDLQQAIGEVTG